MIAATARTIAGRKGTFFSTVALAILGVIAVAVIRTIVNARNPEIHPSIGGAIFVDQAGGLIFFVGVLGGVLIGALAGSYDVAQGTMRYLVMTGVSRLHIYAVRAIALVGVVFVALVPAVLLLLVLAFALPQEDGQGVDGHKLAGTLWSIALFAAATPAAMLAPIAGRATRIQRSAREGVEGTRAGTMERVEFAAASAAGVSVGLWLFEGYFVSPTIEVYRRVD